MKLNIENVEVIESASFRMKHSNDGWDFGLRKIAENVKYPKTLLTEAVKEFNYWCEDKFVDASKYKFVRIAENDPCWQIDFCTAENDGAEVSIYEIYYCGTKRKILQRVIEMAR